MVMVHTIWPMINTSYVEGDTFVTKQAVSTATDWLMVVVNAGNVTAVKREKRK